MIQNTGVIQPKLQPTDWNVGDSGIIYKEVCSDWTPFLPAYEAQVGTYVATQACVTFSAINTIQTQLIQQGINIKLSKRFTAKMSGTTINGNNLQKVLDSIRNDGWLLDEDYPFNKDRDANPHVDWAEFYKEIPQALKDKAKQNLANATWKVNYQWLNLGDCHPDLEALKVQLKQAPIQRATSYNSGMCTNEHATEVFKIDDKFIYIYDSYNGGIVTNSLTYCMPSLMKIVVSPKTVVATVIPPITKDLYVNMPYDLEVVYLQRKLIKLKYLSVGLDTGNFRNLTQQAVYKFQLDHKVASLPILWWNKGRFVYSATRNALNAL